MKPREIQPNALYRRDPKDLPVYVIEIRCGRVYFRHAEEEGSYDDESLNVFAAQVTELLDPQTWAPL